MVIMSDCRNGSHRKCSLRWEPGGHAAAAISPGIHMHMTVGIPAAASSAGATASSPVNIELSQEERDVGLCACYEQTQRVGRVPPHKRGVLLSALAYRVATGTARIHRRSARYCVATQELWGDR